MSSINKRKEIELIEQNEVGTAVRSISVEKQLQRMTLAHMLWEDQFYVDGISSTDVLKKLVAQANPAVTSAIALDARQKHHLRHVPLFLARELARNGNLSASLLNEVIQRPDEMGEFLSIYWNDNAEAPISNQVKKGLAMALGKFNEYQLAKWDKNSAGVSIRDIMFLTHAKPEQGREDLYKRIANKELKTPDTWEVALSGGADKKETFTRLMQDNKLGALAFLRNLRNMSNAGVSDSQIREYAKGLNVEKVLPFRYIAAARIMPKFEDMLEDMMFRSLVSVPKLPGRTVLVIDTSGSMTSAIGGKSELSRLDAAAALAMLAREVCEEVAIYCTAGCDRSRVHATMQLPPRRGFALAEAITGSAIRSKIGGGGIFLVQVMEFLKAQEMGNKVDRVLVFTDEQDCDQGKDPAKAVRIGKKNYIMNIASYKNGINSAQWETITGFSEACLEYIRLIEQI